jgi:hypothetical protein
MYIIGYKKLNKLFINKHIKLCSVDIYKINKIIKILILMNEYQYIN